MLDLAFATPISAAMANPVLEESGSASISESQRVADLARRPGVSLEALMAAAGTEPSADHVEWADIELKYSGYLVRERNAASRLAGMDDFELPETIDYSALTALSIEARQKLAAVQPRSLGQAGRVPGVSPSDLQALVLASIRYRKGRVVSRETSRPDGRLPASAGDF